MLPSWQRASAGSASDSSSHIHQQQGRQGNLSPFLFLSTKTNPIYHYPSLAITIHHYLSLSVTIYHQLSLFITIHHKYCIISDNSDILEEGRTWEVVPLFKWYTSRPAPSVAGGGLLIRLRLNAKTREPHGRGNAEGQKKGKAQRHAQVVPDARRAGSGN